MGLVEDEEEEDQVVGFVVVGEGLLVVEVGVRWWVGWLEVEFGNDM